MNENEKKLALQNMSGENSHQMLLTYLSLAKEIILNRCYPYGAEGKAMPDKYSYKQLEIACYLLNKRGAEGQTAHTENGISRQYESASVPDSMLSDVTPFCGVFG